MLPLEILSSEMSPLKLGLEGCLDESNEERLPQLIESEYIENLVCKMLFETEQNKTETFIEKVKRFSSIEDNDALNDAARQVRTFLKELFNNENFRREFIENSKLTITESNSNQEDIDKKIALLTYEAEMWCYPGPQTFINDDNRMQDSGLEECITKILGKYNVRMTILCNILNVFENGDVGKDQISQQTKVLLYQIQQKLNNENENDVDRNLLKCRINLFFSKEIYKLFYTTDMCEKIQELTKSNNEEINKFIKSGYFSKEQIELLCNKMCPRIEDIYANYSEYQRIYGFLQVNKPSCVKKINQDEFSKYMQNVFDTYHAQYITKFDNAQQQELESDLSNKFGSDCVFSYGINDFNDFLKYIVTDQNKKFDRSYIQKWFYEFATNVYNNRIRLENEKFKQLKMEICDAINEMLTKEQIIDILQRQNRELQQQKEVLQRELQEQIVAQERKNMELQQQKEAVEKKLQKQIAELQSKVREMETVNNQLQNKNQESINSLRQEDLPSDDIYIGFNGDQLEQMEENNERMEDFEEQEEDQEEEQEEDFKRWQEEDDEDDKTENIDCFQKEINYFQKKINEINKNSEKLPKEYQKTFYDAFARLKKINDRIKKQTQKLKEYNPDVAEKYFSQLSKNDDIDEINKYFNNKDESNGSDSAQDEEQDDETINTGIKAYKVSSDIEEREFFEQLKLKDANLEKKIKDTYEEMSVVDKENKKRLKWTTAQVKVTALLLKEFCTEHNRRPDDREEDDDFCKKIQNAVGRKIQCTSFIDYMSKYHKLLYTNFIMNNKRPNIELNKENAPTIFVDEFRKIQGEYKKLTGHKDFKIPAGMIIDNIINDPDKNKCSNFVTIPDPNDERVHEKIFNRVKSDKFINKFETKLNNKNESQRICWEFSKGGVAESSLDTFIEGEDIKTVAAFKRNIIHLCARRELYKFVIQYCLYKKNQIKFEELIEELSKKVSGQKEVSEQEEALVDKISDNVSKIFKDNITSKPENIQKVLNRAYIRYERKRFKQYILKDMIDKINSYMENESQIEDISERLAIVYGLKENKVLKDGENGTPDYYNEELKGKLGGALNKLSNEMNKSQKTNKNR